MDVTISGWVYLPMDQLSDYHIDNMKKKLTIQPRLTTDIAGTKRPDPIYMFHEDFDNGRFGIPRWFYLQNARGNHNEILDITHGNKMQNMETKFKADGPFVEQNDSIKYLMASLTKSTWGGAILNAGCGTGKTVVACEVARRLGRSTLVFCHKEFLVNQWEERILEFMPKARIGRVKQNKCDYKDKDFVIALMQSLSREDGNRYPKEFYDSTFGTVIGDELRRAGSATWSKILPLFKSAYRIGLDATLRRADGAENAFWYHISDVTYKAKSESMIPKVRWLRTGSALRAIKRGEYEVDINHLNMAQIISQLVKDKIRTQEIIDQVILAVKNGRKVIVISERLEHLRDMSELLINQMFSLDLPYSPTVDYYTGEWFTGERYDKKTGSHKKGELKKAKRTIEELYIAESANVILSTKQMVQDALDITALDVLFLANPWGDIEQMAGRIRRWCLPDKNKCKRLCPWRAGKCKGKPSPIIVDVDDRKISALDSKRKRRISFYKEIGSI